MTDPIKTLANRFCAWPLPESVHADLCATDPKYAHHRSGTNLMTVAEAEAMLRHVLDGFSVRETQAWPSWDEINAIAAVIQAAPDEDAIWIEPSAAGYKVKVARFDQLGTTFPTRAEAKAHIDLVRAQSKASDIVSILRPGCINIPPPE